MSLKKAEEFVEKFYISDEFKEKVIRDGKLYENTEEGSNEDSSRIVEAANTVGYNITMEEFEQANKAYADKIGPWKVIKNAFRAVKIAKKVKKEVQKES